MQSFVSTDAKQRGPYQLYKHDHHGLICLHSHKKATDNTTLSLAVKYQHGYEYHTDNGQKTVKCKDYLNRNLATKHSTAKHGQNNQ